MKFRSMKKLLTALVMSTALLVASAVGASACTALFAGGDLTNDGAPIVARSEDYVNSMNKLFIINEAGKYQKGEKFVGCPAYGGFEWTWSHDSYRFTSFTADNVYNGVCPECGEGSPESPVTHDSYTESGANEMGVVVSATETLYGNGKCNAKDVDPMRQTKVDGKVGIEETDIPTVILAEAATAREGIELLCDIYDEYGCYYASGLFIADSEEIWYIENCSGTQYVALKLPSDILFLEPNMAVIGAIDLDDTENVIASDRLIEVAKQANSFVGDEAENIIDFRASYARINVDTRLVNGLNFINSSYNYTAEQLSADNTLFTISNVKDGKIVDLYTNIEADRVLTADDAVNYYKVDAIGRVRNVDTAFFQVYSDRPVETSIVKWTAMDHGGYNVFIPHYPALLDELYEGYGVGTDVTGFVTEKPATDLTYATSKYVYDDEGNRVRVNGWLTYPEGWQDSFFWCFDVLSNYMEYTDDSMADYVKAEFKVLQEQFYEEFEALDVSNPETARANATASAISMAERAHALCLKLIDDVRVAITASDLIEVLGADADLTVAGQAVEADHAYTNEEVVAVLLNWAGMEAKQLGSYPYDYNAMADSLGMSYDATALATEESLAEMKAIADVLYDALHADKLQPLFMNDMAQPIFPYTTGANNVDYDNANSDIIRFCVYVESNYDTDADGKLDLVKALVQIPRAAMEGDYKAATVYEARPYCAGTTDRGRSDGFSYVNSGRYDMSSLYAQPAARVVAGEMTTAELAAVADSNDWYYQNRHDKGYEYEDLEWYDYYLVRGFAVVTSAGIGAKGSEGFETCGSDLEIDAFKCVIEWLHGDRVAYTDKENNIEIKADWSSGKVGMTGRSYAGTTQFGLANTGVAGLETIVPVAGISSWYEYTNAQGISTRSSANYTETLAIYCASRMLDLDDWATISEKYGRYLNELRLEQLSHAGDYGPTWAIRDYTPLWENINCSALIVHGVGDYNVRTKHSHQMYQSFQKAGTDVKVLLHQDGHLTPTYPSSKFQFAIGDQTYDEILNKWFSHYLYGLDNDVQSMPNVLSQNAHENVWDEYETWGTDTYLTLNAASEFDTVSLTSDYATFGVTRSNWTQAFANDSTPGSAMYSVQLDKGVTVNGPVAVNFSAATEAVEGADSLMVSAMLVDLSDEEFSVYNTSGSYVPKNYLMEGGAWMGGGVANYDLVELATTDVTYKVIARGWMDLCNPEAKYDSASADHAKRVDVDGETYYDYTLFLQPTIYNIEAGHELAVVIYAYEPGMAAQKDYTITLDNASVQAVIPVEAAGAGELTANYVDSISVTAEDLTETLGAGVDLTVNGKSFAADHNYTNEELVAVLLKWAGLKESQLGSFPYDYLCMADSMGMTFKNELATEAELEAMKAVAQELYDTLHADKLQPLFMNGMAQPIFPYTTGAVTEGYDNAKSDIIRFCVYVESNYDTDGDGKLDLVKALVQIPRAAMEGDYKAATIYEARPYITGCTSGSTPYVDGGYDIASMYAQPAARVPVGEMTTAEHAANANSADWYYWNPYERAYAYEDLDWYDYYLVRGFAVVESGGIGTKGSGGFETCGSDLEIDAFKCVIEWLHGDRVAYTDAESNIEIKADWANGKVGMTGRSYAGTTQFGLATTGVEGLETIVPVAGIASWYEYTNSQGISTNRSPAYTEWLAWYCAGRRLDDADWATIADKYGRYLRQVYNDQMAIAGDYSYEHWGIRDYTLDWENIKAPALIVHGINDYNVRTKQSDLMQQAYQKAGVDYKVILHQDGHLTPTYPAGKLQFDIGDQGYDEILNKWFSHYLYDLDNGVEKMANVTAQDAHENVWHEYESWGTDNYLTVNAVSDHEITISSDYNAIGATRSNFEKIFTATSTPSNALYVVDVTEDIIVNGAVAVNFSAATEAVEGADSLMVSAMLVDLSDEEFNLYQKSGSYVPKTTLMKGGAWMGGGVANYDKVELALSKATQKVISYGWMDLCNPSAKYDSETALHTNRVDVDGETYYDYTIYLQSTIYDVEAGHKLAVVLYAQDPSKNTPTSNYSFTVKDVNAVIPVEDEDTAGTWTAEYQDIEYAELSVAADGMGAVTSTLDNGTVVAHSYVTVTADAYGGYKFVNWTLNGEVYSTRTSVTYQVIDDTELVAHFVKAGNSSSTPIDPVEPSIPVEPVKPVEPTFTDVAADSAIYDAVEYVVDNGLMVGVSETEFAPNTILNRAMIVQILWAKEGKPAVTENVFSDVAADDWFADAVNWAASKGIVAGVGEGKFAPLDTLTHEQVAVILYSYIGKPEAKGTAPVGTADWAATAMAWATGANVISADVAPQAAVTRGDMAQILLNLSKI